MAIRLMRTVLRGLLLGWVDTAAGLALRVLVMGAILSAVFAAIQSFPVLGLHDTIEHSVLGPFLADNFDVLLRVLKLVRSDFRI